MRIADSACVLTRIVVPHKDFHVTHVRTVSVEELDAMAKSYKDYLGYKPYTWVSLSHLSP